MSIESTYSPNQFNCDGATVNFTFAFPIFASTDLLVVVTNSAGVDTTLTLNIDYTVVPSGQDYSNGGVVTTVATYPTGSVLTVASAVKETQSTSFPTNGPLPARNIERALDKLTVIDQQHKEQLARAFKVAITDQGGTFELPNAATRASSYLAFDANGNIVVSPGVPGVVTSAFMKTVLDDLTAAAALTTLGFSAFVQTIIGAATAAAARSILDAYSQEESIRASIEWSKPVGELYFRVGKIAPAGWDSANPQNYNPAICIDATDQTLDVAHWPDVGSRLGLVNFLRAKKGVYNEGGASEKSDFTVTNWSITSNVVTLTFALSPAEQAMLSAIYEAYQFHSSYPGTITIPTTFGSVVAGDYVVTGVVPASRTLTFALTAANGSGAGTWTVNFYPFRIVGSTTTAKILAMQGLALMSPNDGDELHIGGYARRSYFQGHNFAVKTGTNSTSATISVLGTNNYGGVDVFALQTAASDGTNGTPRTGKETEPRSLSAHLMIHGGRYVV